MGEGAPVGVILNPAAAGGRALELLPRVVAALRGAGRAHHVHVTWAPREATAVAERFARDGVRLVLAVGGDGTVNETVEGLVRGGVGGSPCLGIVPVGRGADFARTLGTPREPEAAVRAALAGRTRRLDLGRVAFADGTSRVFANVAGVGFDAAVAERTQRSRLPGRTAPYLVGTLGTLARWRNPHVEVTAGELTLAGRARAVVVANGAYFGGGMRIAPGADPADGRLDLALIGDVSALGLLRALPSVYRGAHLAHPAFRVERATEVRIETGAEVPVHVDGEPAGHGPVRITVEPAALLVAG